MSISRGNWNVSPTDASLILAEATPDRPYSTVVCDCVGLKAEREANARAISMVPQIIELLERLTSRHGPIIITYGIASFPDGTTLDLDGLLINLTGHLPKHTVTR